MKKIVVYGNCQAGAVFNTLNCTPVISDDYQLIYHDLWPDTERLEKECLEMVSADIVLIQSISNWRNHPLCGKMPDNVRVIEFPFVYFAAIWPFDSFVFGPDKRMLSAKQLFSAQGFVVPHPTEDGLIARLREIDDDPALIYKKYLDWDHSFLSNIVRYASFEEARLLKMDRDMGMTIGKYVIDNYRQKKLFHALIHPTWDLIERLSLGILNKIIPGFSMKDVGSHPDYCSTHEVPVHPKIIRDLGLDWVSENDYYNVHGHKIANFETWYSGYCKFVFNVEKYF